MPDACEQCGASASQGSWSDDGKRICATCQSKEETEAYEGYIPRPKQLSPRGWLILTLLALLPIALVGVVGFMSEDGDIRSVASVTLIGFALAVPPAALVVYRAYRRPGREVAWDALILTFVVMLAFCLYCFLGLVGGMN